MKKNSIYISTLLVLSIIIVSMVYLLQLPQDNHDYDISVIVPHSNDAMWKRFEAGLREASDMYPVNVNFVNTMEVETSQQQLDVINEEIENGADGIVVQFMKSVDTEEVVTKIVERTQLELLGTDIAMYDMDRSKIDTVMVDDTLLATTLTSMIFDDLSRDLRFKRIGIMAGNVETENMQERLDVVSEILESAGAEIEWIVTGNQEEMLQKMQSVNLPSFIVGLDSYCVDAAIAYANSNHIGIYGIGCSDENVYELDQGVVKAMVVPDMYMAGYQCVQSMYRQLTFDMETTNIIIDFNTVNRENMFSKINENILFPIGE